MWAWAGFAVGICLLLVTLSSVLKTLLIPRNLSSLLGYATGSLVLLGYRLVTWRVADLDRREKILSAGAPTYLIGLLTAWVSVLYLAFTLLLLPFTATFAQALRMSGSSLFTLGFTVPAGAVPYGLVFAAASSGLGVIALMIGYLPTLYSAFSRREVLVSMLEALAGKPPWGPELLARQQLIGNVASMDRLYERWTEWAADVGESHSTYRALNYFRSRVPANPWPLALLAVLDAAALQLSLCPDSAPVTARPLLRVGYLNARQLARVLGVPVSEDPGPDDPMSLTREDFEAAARHLEEAGWVLERKPDQAWPHFRGWRVNYEQAIYGIAAHLDLVAAVWSGSRARLGKQVRPNRPRDRQPRSAP